MSAPAPLHVEPRWWASPDDFSLRLWQGRLIARLSQAELGRRAGYCQRQITELEHSIHQPRVSTALDLLECVGIELTVSWFGDEPERVTSSSWRRAIGGEPTLRPKQ